MKKDRGVNLKASSYVYSTEDCKRYIEMCKENEWPCVMIYPGMDPMKFDDKEKVKIVVPKIDYDNTSFDLIVKSGLLDSKVRSLHNLGMVYTTTCMIGLKNNYFVYAKKEFREIVAEEIYRTLEMLFSEMRVNMFNLFIKIANEKYDGHFTLMKFTGNWRCCFGTPSGDSRENIYQMEEGKTMDEAIKLAILNDTCAYNFRPLTNQELYYEYKGGTIRK